MECDTGGGRNTSTRKALQGKMNLPFLHLCLSLVQNLQEEIFSHWHYFSDSNEHLGFFFFFLSLYSVLLQDPSVHILSLSLQGYPHLLYLSVFLYNPQLKMKQDDISPTPQSTASVSLVPLAAWHQTDILKLMAYYSDIQSLEKYYFFIYSGLRPRSW